MIQPSVGARSRRVRRPLRHPRPSRSRRAALHLFVFVLLGGAGGACAPVYSPPAAPVPADIPVLEARLADGAADVEAMVSLAAAYRGADRVADARALLERALTLEPGHANAIFYLGLTYEDLEDYAQAKTFYRRYIEVGGSAELKSALEERLRLVERKELLAAVRNALDRETALAATPPRPRTVAVFPFLFAARDPALEPLGRALAELLVTDLAQTDRLTVVERVRVQMLLDEMRLAETGVVEPATAARTGRLLGAGRIVQGRIEGDDASLRLEAVVVGVGGDWNGRVVPVAEEAALRGLFDMEKRLAFRIYQSLGVELTVAERERIGRRPTENLRALLEFGLGLAASDDGRFAEAARHFSSAASLDANFDAARSRAAAAEATAAAAVTTTGQLARQSVDGGPAATAFGLLDGLVPAFGGRDAVSELLGREGIGSEDALIHIILRVR